MKERLCTLLIGVTLLLPLTSFASTSVTPDTAGAGAEPVAESKITANGLIAKATKLKADKKYYKAADTLLRAAKLSGGARSIGLRTEAATLFGWSGAHDKAKATYLSLIEEDPKNRGARLGLAQSYAWTGNYASSIEQYDGVLKDNPGYAPALIGKARVWSWMGEYDNAIEGFSEVLRADTENTEAREAKARTLWWKGEHASSVDELDVILTKKPEDKRIKRLKRRIKWDAGPTISLYGNRSSDSDSNRIRALKVSAYLNHKSAGKLHLELTRYDTKRHSDKGHATVVTLKDAIRLSSKVKLRSRISVVSSEAGVTSNSYLTGGLSANIRLQKKVRAILSISRAPYLDTTQLIRNNVRVNSYSATLLYDIKSTTISGGISFNDFSDSNTSYSLRANIAHTVLKEPDYTLTAGYIPEYKSFSKKTFSGYYNPSKFFSNQLYLNIKGLTYSDRFVYEATVTAGVQNATKNEFTGAVRLGATYYIKENLSAEVAAKWSKSALATSTGFRSETYKAGLNYLF